jgi:hypothetical protein
MSEIKRARDILNNVGKELPAAKSAISEDFNPAQTPPPGQAIAPVAPVQPVTAGTQQPKPGDPQTKPTPGMVTVQKGTVKKTIPAAQLATYQKQGYTVVSDSAIKEDWGSSDWYPILTGMDKYIAEHGFTPENVAEVAKEMAERYNEHMGYDDIEDCTDRIVHRWLMHKGYKKPTDTLSESVDDDGYHSNMARSELFRNTKYATEMTKMLHADDDIEPLIAKSLDKAVEYLKDVSSQLEGSTDIVPMDMDSEDEEIADDEDDSTISLDSVNEALSDIVHYSTSLFSSIQPGDKLPGWVTMKLTKASECVSSSKHYLEYTQFEKHAGDMLGDIQKMATEGAKMSKKPVRESVGQKLARMMMTEDQDLQQAQTLTAAKALSDDLQSMAEKVARMSVEDLMPLVDTMKDQFGQEAAEGYNSAMKEGLTALLDTVTKAKETSDNAIHVLQGGEPMATDANAEQDLSAELPAGPEDADLDAAAPTGEEPMGDEEANLPLGREKKDDAELSESKSGRRPKKENFLKAGTVIFESAPAGKKAEDFIKGNKASFKERYGKKGEEVLYRTAWKKFGAKNENYVKAEAMLETNKKALAQLNKMFESHKAKYSKMLKEGKVDDPLNMGYGLEGENILDRIVKTTTRITKLKEALMRDITAGATRIIMSEQASTKAAKLTAAKSAAPYGVLFKDTDGTKQRKFFESAKLRGMWMDLNTKSLNEHVLVNPEDFDTQINKLNETTAQKMANRLMSTGSMDRSPGDKVLNKNIKKWTEKIADLEVDKTSKAANADQINNLKKMIADAKKKLNKKPVEEAAKKDDKKPVGEYYAEFDKADGLWCVFNTDDVGKKKSGHCFGAHSTKAQADDDAKKRNDATSKKINESKTEAGLKDNEPRKVSGVKGAKSTPFTKKFKNSAAMDKWMDSDEAGDYTVDTIERC